MFGLCLRRARKGARLVSAKRALLASAAVFAPLTFGLFGSGPADAACTQVGQDVTCTDTTSNYDSGAQANLNVTVQPGATVIGTGGSDAIRITSTTTGTLINNGVIDGFVTILSGTAGSDTFSNNGILKITDPTANLQVHSMAGTNFIQNASGTFFARVDAAGFNDGILSWSATLNGKLVVVVQPGTYTAVNTYASFINTLTGTTGNFSSVVSSSPFFTVALQPNGINLDLILTRIGLGSVQGMTPNQMAVGNALERSYSTTLTGNAATFYSNLLAAASVTVLDQLGGEGTSAAQTAAFNAASLFNNAMQGQGLFGSSLNGLSVTVPAAYADARPPGHDAFAALNAPPAAQPGGWRIWTAGFGASNSLQGEASTGSYDQSIQTAGGLMGVEWQAAPDFRVGAAGGASESTFSVRDLSTSGRLIGGHAGLYAVKNWSTYYAAASVSYARYDNKTERTIAGVGDTERASGRFAGDQVSGRLEVGWKTSYGRTNVTPFVAVEPAVLWQRGYTESGAGILGLSVASEQAMSLPVFVGVQFDGHYVAGEGAVLAPYSRASWVHELEPDRRVTGTFITVPGATFTVDGARAASDAVRLDNGVRLTFHARHSLFVNFGGEWSGRTQSYAATGGFRAAW